MTYGQFFYTLGVGTLLSVAVSIGVTSYMLDQRDQCDKVEDAPLSFSVVEYSSPEVNTIRYQANLDEGLSKYSGVEVIDAYKLDDIAEAKLQIEEGRRFCKASDASLVKIKFYRMTSPYIKCSNGVTDK